MGPMSNFIAPMLSKAMEAVDSEPAYAKLPMIAEFIAAEKGVSVKELIDSGQLFPIVLERLTGIKPEQQTVHLERCPKCLHVQYLITE